MFLSGIRFKIMVGSGSWFRNMVGSGSRCSKFWSDPNPGYFRLGSGISRRSDPYPDYSRSFGPDPCKAPGIATLLYGIPFYALTLLFSRVLIINLSLFFPANHWEFNYNYSNEFRCHNLTYYMFSYIRNCSSIYSVPDHKSLAKVWLCDKNKMICMC